MPDVFGSLKERPIWVAWDNKGGRKVPKSPSGGNAKSNDPATWSTFEQAQDAAKKHGYTGIGIMLTDGLVGIDLDHCVKDGKIEPWAKEIIDSMGGYAELSPSGTGVHIIGYADPSVVGAIGRADHKRGIEIYNHGRYFTVTGKAIGKGSVSDCTSQVASFMETTFPAPSKEDRATDQLKTLVSSQVMRLANETMVKNVSRDSGRGVRFARVPQGRETCLFCIMLASRGFVYYTKETAGEFNHYHVHCDCKVMPGLEGTSIEGYDPDRYLDLWSQGRALKEEGYSKSQVDAYLQGATLGSLGGPNSGRGGRPKSRKKDGLFHTRNDPAVDYYGPLYETNEGLLDRIIHGLEDLGVEVIAHEEEVLAYGPSAKAGVPGQLHLWPGASFSAILHELTHFWDDQAKGFPPSSETLYNRVIRVEWEKRAYSREIELARLLGNGELAEKLESLCAEEVHIYEQP